MKSPGDDIQLIDKKKDYLEKKRYDQLHKNYNQQSLKHQGMTNGSNQNSSTMPNIVNDGSGDQQ